MKTKKRFLSILLSLVLVLGMLPGMGLTVLATDYISIGSTEELKKIGVDDAYPLSGNYRLTADINMDKVIGDTNNKFTGVFDGNGHTIELNISSNEYRVGLFSDLAGTVKNLKVTGSVSSSNNDVGGIAGFGHDNGKVIQCWNDATVSGGPQAGGVVGASGGATFKVENCLNTGTISGSGNRYAGITGYQYQGSIVNCFSTNSGIATDGNSANSRGPICTVSNSYYSGDKGVDNLSSAEAKLSEDAMKDKASYSDWDFTDVWEMTDQGPRLRLFQLHTHDGITATVTKAPTAKALTYTGSAQELVTEGEATGGTMQYALGNATEATEQYTTSIPSKTDAGTYYVWYKVAGDNDHSDSEAAFVPVTLAPDSVTLTANSGTETYDGTEKTVSGFTSSVEGLTFTGVSASGSGTNADEYAVTFSGVTAGETKDTTGNYVVTATTNGKLTVNPAPLTITAKDQSIYVGESLPAWDMESYTVTGLMGEDTLTTEPSGAYQKDGEALETTKRIGTYAIVPSGAVADNYAISYVGGKLTIRYWPVDDDPTPTETVTLPLSGGGETASMTVEATGDTATIKEADIDKVLEAENVGTVTIDVSRLKENVNEVVIPGTMLNTIADAVADQDNDADGLAINLPGITISFDDDAITAIAEQANGEDLTIHMDEVAVTQLTSAQQSAVQELEVEIVLDADLTANGQRISDFKGGNAIVKVPYTLKNGRTAAGIVVWYIASDGARTQVPSSYDGENVVFVVPHFSNYVIAYDAEKAAACPKDSNCPMSAFSDLDPTQGYHDGIHFCLENGMMNGVGNGRFDPSGTTSRAMIVTILYRLENEPDLIGKANPFDDVADGQWYTKAVLWAAENNIVCGYGNGKFGPNDPITREQLATILYRYAQVKGQGFTGAWMFLLDYPDASEISSWADEAMHWMVMHSILQSKDGKLVPGGNASRAEAATMLMRYCTLLAE